MDYILHAVKSLGKKKSKQKCKEVYAVGTAHKKSTQTEKHARYTVSSVPDTKTDPEQCNVKSNNWAASETLTPKQNDLSIKTALNSNDPGHSSKICYNVPPFLSGRSTDHFSKPHNEQADKDPAVNQSHDDSGPKGKNTVAQCNYFSKDSVKRLETKMLDLCGLHVLYPDKGFFKDTCNNMWQLQELITTKGGFLQTKQSDVRLTIKENSVEKCTTISGSVLLDIPFVRKKFNLKSTDIVVAPAVEYHLQDETHLKRHGCLELPHCMSSRKVLKMQVWWCVNVGGNITKHSVPHDEPNEDIYWTKGKRPGTINVFAKHFCVILCTACTEYVEFEIRALLFHKFGDVSDPLSLTIQLQLGGPLSKIRDFEQDIKKRMKEKHLTFVEDSDIDLVPQLEGVLKIHLEVLTTSDGSWVHMKRANGDPVYESEKKLEIKKISQCGNEHVINNCNMKWWLQRSTTWTRACCFYTDVKHDAENETSATTTMHADLKVPEYLNSGTGDRDDSNLVLLAAV